MKKLGILEGLLFVVGDEGLSLNSICEIMDIDELEAKKLLTGLKEKYEKEKNYYFIYFSYLYNCYDLWCNLVL